MKQTPELNGLMKIIDNLPKTNIRLCKMKKENEREVEHEAPAMELDITDHDVVAGSDRHGTFATLNVLNPNSPVAPGFAPEGIDGMRRLFHEDEKQQHIELIAALIIDLFKQGVDALALQEIPSQLEPYYVPFITHLKKLSAENSIQLDWDAFFFSYALTKKPFRDNQDQGCHGFATGLLIKQDIFKLEQVTPVLNGRGSEYKLFSSLSNEFITLINLHGFYGKATETAQYIALSSNKPNTIIMGDTNIPLDNAEAVGIMQKMRGVAVEPSSNQKNTAISSRTLDCFVTKIPHTRFLFNRSCNNLANGETSGYDPFLFSVQQENVVGKDIHANGFDMKTP